jgi:PilZ domain
MPISRSVTANPVETGFPRVQLPLVPDRGQQDRMLTNLPIRIVGIDGAPTYYPGICTNLSREGIGFETSARLEVGKVIEFKFIQVTDEAIRHWLRILFRSDRRYGGYYVNDDGSDILAPN